MGSIKASGRNGSRSALGRLGSGGLAMLCAAGVQVAACSDSGGSDSQGDAGDAGSAGTTPLGGSSHLGGTSQGGTPHAGTSQGGTSQAGTTGEAGQGPTDGGTHATVNGGAAGDAAAGEPGLAGNASGGAGGDGAAQGFTWPTTHPALWDGTLPASGVCSVNGFCWSHPAQSNNEMNAVWASSPTSVWVAGTSGTLAHYNGSTWSGVTAVDAVDFHLLRGTAGSATNVWAVGWLDSPDDQVFYRFDGTTWTEMDPPLLPVRDIWATGTNELWTADAGGYVSHWDGATWHDCT